MLSVMNLHEKNMLPAPEPSSYTNNMMLPEMVQATRLKPLGPDCIISSTGVTDQTLLNSVNYYWYISQETGCVECVMKKSGLQENVIASDPRCVVTRKHRRFEAYCCMLCRSNFVTIVQALLHMKAMHRPTSKILIQDKDIFHNIDKAMEVPPVPLPWHIARKLVEQEKTDLGPTPTFVIPPGGALVADKIRTSSDELATGTSLVQNFSKVASSLRQSPSPQTKVESHLDDRSPSSKDFSKVPQNPMVCIITAIVQEFKKQISHLTFKDDCSQANANFVDGTSVIAKTPDLVKTEDSSKMVEDSEMDEALYFTVHYDDVPSEGNSSDLKHITLRANRPSLARRLLSKTISKGARLNSDSEQNSSVTSTDASNETSTSDQSKSVTNESTTQKSVINRPVKSVRFQLGAPDSSDDERPDTPGQDMSSHLSKKENNAEGEIGDKKFEGLRSVVEDLITTASKGRISIPPTSPHTTSSSMSAFATTSTLPLVESSPALSNMMQLSSGVKTKVNSLTRVQSWSPSLGGTSFSVASMRRPYTARGFTYAEKIELMKQQNDYDAEFTTKHIRKTTGSSSVPSISSTSITTQAHGGTSVTQLASSTKKENDHKFTSKPLVHNDDSSSDGEVKHHIHDEHGTNRHADDEQSSDFDESPPTMLSNVHLAAAYSNLLKHGIYSEYYGSGEWAAAAMETLKTLQSSMKSQEESSPHATRKRMLSQGNVSSLETKIKQEHVDSHYNYATSQAPSKIPNDQPRESLSDDSASLFVQSSHHRQLNARLTGSRKRCKSNNEFNMPTEESIHSSLAASKRSRIHKKRSKSSVVDAVVGSTDSESSTDANLLNLTEAETSESTERLKSVHAQHAAKTKLYRVVDKVVKSSNMPLSPLLTSAEKELILHQPKREKIVTSSSPSVPTKLSDLSQERGVISYLTSKSMGMKCSSDPALSSSSTSKNCLTSSSSNNKSMLSSRISDGSSSMNVQQSSAPGSTPAPVKEVIATNGDSLAFLGDVTLKDFESNNPIFTKLQQTSGSNAFLEKRLSNNAKMNMPEVFQNCIETRLKIQLIEKVHVCKVCGFSIAAIETSESDHDMGKALRSHVMEHSLKELYATGCEMGKW